MEAASLPRVQEPIWKRYPSIPSNVTPPFSHIWSRKAKSLLKLRNHQQESIPEDERSPIFADEGVRATPTKECWIREIEGGTSWIVRSPLHPFVRTAIQTIESSHESVLKSIVDLYEQPIGDSPFGNRGITRMAKDVDLTMLAPHNKATVMILGNHSSGKSSYINCECVGQ